VLTVTLDSPKFFLFADGPGLARTALKPQPDRFFPLAEES
jgi:hypothetical protein